MNDPDKTSGLILFNTNSKPKTNKSLQNSFSNRNVYMFFDTQRSIVNMPVSIDNPGVFSSYPINSYIWYILFLFLFVNQKCQSLAIWRLIFNSTCQFRMCCVDKIVFIATRYMLHQQHAMTMTSIRTVFNMAGSL